MRLIKRITILAALAAMTAGASGCSAELDYLLGRLTDCAHGEQAGTEDACDIELMPPGEGQPDPPVEPVPPIVEPSVAAAGRRGKPKPFTARFTAKSVTPPVVSKRPGGAAATNVVARGRFRGSFAGDSRTGRRFSSGRWISRGELNYQIRSRKVTGDAYMLLRFKRRGAGSLCLSVQIKAVGTKRGTVETRGRFVALGGTGAAAKMAGSGSFSQLSGAGTGRLRARGRLRTATARPLPPLCAALARTR